MEKIRKITLSNPQTILGKGGQSYVFHGVFQRKPVAVKRLMLEDVDSICKQEEEALGRLTHPNVVRLFHAESDSNFRYYALELCEASLDKLFLDDSDGQKYRGPVPVVEDMLLQLATGLEYIHGQNVVHRDLKPENVLIYLSNIESSREKNRRVAVMKWADFGLSKQANERGTYSMSDIKGTLTWFAPEILEMLKDKTLKRRGTNKSDVFAEGLTFGYILLDGKHVYGDENEVRYNLYKNDAINLKRIAAYPKKGKLLYEMLCSMLKLNPNDRLTAKEVSQRLQQIYGKNADDNRAANTIKLQCQKLPVHHSGSIDVYKLPIEKQDRGTTPGVGHYAFGELNNLALTSQSRKRTILVLGATGSGKTTLINAMINYILDVKWEDDFRFKMIDEPADKSQEVSQTDMITTYDLHHMKGSRLEYSLTVVDTPGFGDIKRGVEKDKEIMEQIQKYFQCRHGIQQLEVVCFVVKASLARLTETQKYIFDSILSIFGNDIKDKIRLMVTFSDGAEPPVLETAKEAGIPLPINPATGLPLHHKFNNSIFFTTNKNPEMNEIQETYFEIAVTGFDQFFNDLSRMEATSLTLTREVLEERKRLEELVEGLQMRTEIKLTRVDELEQIKKILTENKEKMEANKDFEFEVEVLIPKAINISQTGQFTTNCQKCQMTCHFPCRQASNENKNECSVMDSNGRCKICNCPWNGHYNQKYRYEMVKEKVKRSSDAIRKEYQGAVNQALTNQQLLESVEKKIEENEQQLIDLMQATYPHVKRLDEIALRPNPTSDIAYIDLMIETEKRENRQGYQRRIANLQKLRKMAELKSEVLSGKVAATSAHSKIDNDSRKPASDAGSVCLLS